MIVHFKIYNFCPFQQPQTILHAVLPGKDEFYQHLLMVIDLPDTIK